jgi:hypothetical protein
LHFGKGIFSFHKIDRAVLREFISLLIFANLGVIRWNLVGSGLLQRLALDPQKIPHPDHDAFAGL